MNMRQDAGLSQSSMLMDMLFALTIATLFSGLNRDVGPVKVQLSDLFAALSVFVAVLRGFATPRASVSLVVLLAGYLLLYWLSALAVGTMNGMKEIMQSVLVISFVFVVFGYYRTRSTDRLLLIASVLMLAILTINIAYHVNSGRYVGWKELNEPKTLFIILPLLLALLFDRFAQRRWIWAFLFIAAALIILLSGERKAYLFALAAAAIWTSPLNWRHVLMALLVAPFIWFALASDGTSYLHRQVRSVTSGLADQSEQPLQLTALLDERRPTTLSNAQREFSNRLAFSMWKEKPILGIGTNAFVLAMEQQPTIPPMFRKGIHGEFHRALFENGMVGLALYGALWLAAFACLLTAWPANRAAGAPSLNKLKLLCVLMFLIYCGFEASKGLTLYCITALPFVVAIAPRVRTARQRHWEPAGPVLRNFASN
jgi:O-Antigen ligase